MLYLLHGDDTAASRKFLSELTEEIPVTILDGKSLNISSLEENIVSKSLFEERKAVVVENLFGKNAKKKDIAKFINSQISPTTPIALIFWEEKKLLKTSLSLLKNATIREFVFPSYYFQFLDSISPVNKSQTYSHYQSLLATSAPELILFSMIKRIRQLVIIQSGVKSEELQKMSPWQLQKLQQQLKSWNKENLKMFFKQLQQAEIKLKTGNLPTSLSKYLDILILSKLL